MKVIVAGHHYEVTNAEANKIVGTIHFLHKEQRNGKLVQVANGTTTEEVIRVVIDRLEHLNSKVKSKENKSAISHLMAALAALESRTKDRVKRGVEGTSEL